MVAGVGSWPSWRTSSPTARPTPCQQRDAIVSALIGLTLVVAGAALFVKASLATFLRFWMARLCYEQQAQTDRLLGNAPVNSSAPLPPSAIVQR